MQFCTNIIEVSGEGADQFLKDFKDSYHRTSVNGWAPMDGVFITTNPDNAGLPLSRKTLKIIYKRDVGTCTVGIEKEIEAIVGVNSVFGLHDVEYGVGFYSKFEEMYGKTELNIMYSKYPNIGFIYYFAHKRRLGKPKKNFGFYQARSGIVDIRKLPEERALFDKTLLKELYDPDYVFHFLRSEIAIGDQFYQFNNPVNFYLPQNYAILARIKCCARAGIALAKAALAIVFLRQSNRHLELLPVPRIQVRKIIDGIVRRERGTRFRLFIESTMHSEL